MEKAKQTDWNGHGKTTPDGKLTMESAAA